jgi:hypothetical protein
LSLLCSGAASAVYWLACWPLVPKIAGSNPAEAVGFFPGVKNPDHAFLWKGSKAVGPMSYIYGTLKISCGFRGSLARSFPPSLIEGSVRPEQFEALPRGRGPHARSGLGTPHERAAHSERFGPPPREAAGSVGMDAPRDDGGI